MTPSTASSLARATGRSGEAGAFLDSVTDRVTDGLLFGSLAIWGGGTPLGWAAVGALVSSYVVSYTRARGASVGVDPALGLMQRPQRLILTLVALALNALLADAGHPLLLATLVLVTLASLATAIARIRFVMGALNREGAIPRSDAPIDPDYSG